MKVKYLSTTCLLLLLIFSTVFEVATAAEAQEVHALLVIMDADTRIGQSAQEDEENIRKLLRKVDSTYRTNITVLRSSDGVTTTSNIQRAIRALNPATDDVVFFYFSGHGGMVSKTDRRTYLIVSSDTNMGESALLMRSDVESAITSHNCRLHIIITDCSETYPGSGGREEYGTFVEAQITTQALGDLFGRHEGLLHVNSATEGQFGRRIQQIGGIFTDGFVAAIADAADIDGDEFLEWREVLKVATVNTSIRSTLLTDVHSREPRAIPQVPKLFSIPKRLDGRDTDEFQSQLWDLSNRDARSRLGFQADKRFYRRGDPLTLTLRPDTDCYFTVLSWQGNGDLMQLFPNRLNENNWLRAGRVHRIPRQGAHEIFMGGTGTERLKVIAVTDRNASNAINKVFSSSDNSSSIVRSHSVRAPGASWRELKFGVEEVVERIRKEEEIMRILERLDRDDWTEARQKVFVK